MTIIPIWVIISVIITILILKYNSKKSLSYRKKVLSENSKKDLSRGTQGTTDCNEYLSYKDLY